MSSLSAYLLRKYVCSRFGKPPIILGGAPRSGTTLLLSILGSHPGIYCIDYETASLHPKVRPMKLLKFLLLESKTELRRIPADKERFCEKTPGNILHVPEIVALFEGRVKVINIFRDGRDVVTSKHPLRPTEYWVGVETWIDHVEHGVAAGSSDAVMSIKYEDLISNTAETLQRICSFIDEELDDRMLNHERFTNVTANLAWFEGARGVGGQSLMKWQRPEHGERVAEFMSNERAVELLKLLGYVP